MGTEWHSVRCYPMRRYSNAKSSRMYSYVATGTICVSDGIPLSSTPIIIKPLATDLEASLTSVYETVEAAKTLHSMLVVSTAMSAWCCSFCCCCLAPAMYDESDTVGRSLSRRISRVSIAVLPSYSDIVANITNNDNQVVPDLPDYNSVTAPETTIVSSL